MQSVISDYVLQRMFNTQITTGRSVKSKGSSKGSSKDSSEKESLALLQNESRAKRKLKLLEARQKLEREQAEEDYLWGKEIYKLTQGSDVFVSNEVLAGLKTLGQIKNTWANLLIDASPTIPPISEL